jgi:hypothetical protein
MDKNLLEEDKELTLLKANIGFGTAFKATLGFYAAQFVATILGLFILGIVAAIGLGVVYLLTR